MNNEISNRKISVIVPVYNAEKYLEQCLESIKNQSYQNFEVILVMMILQIILNRFVKIF